MAKLTLYFYILLSNFQKLKYKIVSNILLAICCFCTIIFFSKMRRVFQMLNLSCPLEKLCVSLDNFQSLRFVSKVDNVKYSQILLVQKVLLLIVKIFQKAIQLFICYILLSKYINKFLYY